MKLLVCLLLMTPVVKAEDEDYQNELKHLKLTLWPQAYRTQDAELLSRILHPQFQMMDADGNTTTRQQELDYVTTHVWQADNFSYRIDRLELFGGHTAIISGMGSTDDYSYHSSNVLIREDDRWQAIASHVSGFVAKQAE